MAKAKKPAAKTKAASKKAPAKKAAVKKTAPKKSAPKKAAAKKTAPKKAAAKKAAPKKAAAKKAAPKKASVKKAAPKKVAVKKTAPKKAAPKKAAAKKTAPAKAAPKKVAEKKTAPATKPAPAKAAPKKAAPVKAAPPPAPKPKPKPKPKPEPLPDVKKTSPDKLPFQVNDHVVYPTHGVGLVEEILIQDIAGHRLELYVISFDRDRMTLRVPVSKVANSGLRKLSTKKQIEEALVTLKGRARIKRTMWSRRAQEYEAKINSGDPIQIAEVVRDLHRNVGQPDQSFSERQIYESARDRLASEVAAIDKSDMDGALTKMESYLKGGTS